MNDLTVGNEAKKILFFAFPILLSNIFQQLYNIVDAIIVGRLLGEKELAAVGAAITLYSVILAVALGLTLGLSILYINLYLFRGKEFGKNKEGCFDRNNRQYDNHNIYHTDRGCLFKTIIIDGKCSGEYN